jgi:hypothetical protein
VGFVCAAHTEDDLDRAADIINRSMDLVYG